MPFYIRAGKCLPVTCTEVVVRLRKPPTMFTNFDLKSNYLRFRISPDIVFALGMMVLAPETKDDQTVAECVESVATEHPRPRRGGRLRAAAGRGH